MLVSTKGRYALRVIIDLAENGNDGYTPLKDIAARQEISLKYLECIMTALSKSGLVDGVHGKGGGYRLNRSPKEYKVGDILRATDGPLVPVACLDCNSAPCARADDCRTLPMWRNLDKIVTEYLDGICIADLTSNNS